MLGAWPVIIANALTLALALLMLCSTAMADNLSFLPSWILYTVDAADDMPLVNRCGSGSTKNKKIICIRVMGN